MLIRDPRKENIIAAKASHDAWLVKMGINPKTPPKQTRRKLKNPKFNPNELPDLKVNIGRSPVLPSLADKVPANGTKSARV